MTRDIELHFEYENMKKQDAGLLRHELELRRRTLLDIAVTVQNPDLQPGRARMAGTFVPCPVHSCACDVY